MSDDKNDLGEVIFESACCSTDFLREWEHGQQRDYEFFGVPAYAIAGKCDDGEPAWVIITDYLGHREEVEVYDESEIERTVQIACGCVALRALAGRDAVLVRAQ